MSAADPRLTEGLAAHRAGRFAEAERLYREVLAAAAGDRNAIYLLSLALHQQGRSGEALPLIERVIAARPDFAAFHNNRGEMLRALGRTDEALDAYRRAIALDPGSGEAFSNMSAALRQRERRGEALAAADRAAALAPDLPEAHNNRGILLLEDGRIGDAVDALKRALALRPAYADAMVNLGHALAAAGCVAEWRAHVADAIRVVPGAADLRRSLAFSTLYDDAATGADVLEAAREWASALHAPAIVRHARSRDRGRRLRIGYVSPDFRRHSCAYFLAPLLAHHDRAAFETTAYAELRRPDEVTAELRPYVDAWRDTVALPDAALVEQIRSDGIDILVDLAGHSAGNRLTIFAAKPAPVQISWLGYPGPTGLATIDARITDAVADPPGAADGHYLERLVRLDRCFVCYRPPADAPAVVPREAPPPDRVVFCSFNSVTKVGDACVAAWAEILSRTPGSTLRLKCRGMTDPFVAERLVARFRGLGIAAERLVLLPWREATASHLSAYDGADIALDTFPYNGTTTTLEALWMGVPVITYAGDRHAARVGASLLRHAGIEDLVAASRDDYIVRAVALAADPARRAAYRAGLRARIAASPLCDGPGFARAMGAAYRDVWQRQCEDMRRA